MKNIDLKLIAIQEDITPWRFVIPFILVIQCFGCSSGEIKRTRLSDPVLRISIDAESLPIGSYVRLQKSLVDSNAFVVVDRANGFNAIDKEQNLQHGTDRFGKQEKYAQLHKMYGVGGIIVGIQQCEIRNSYSGDHYYRCLENLSLLNATTGEAMAVSEKKVDTSGSIDSPDWTEAVNDLIQNYPKVFAVKANPHQTIDYQEPLTKYREEIKEPKDRAPASTEDSDQ